MENLFGEGELGRVLLVYLGVENSVENVENCNIYINKEENVKLWGWIPAEGMGFGLSRGGKPGVNKEENSSFCGVILGVKWGGFYENIIRTFLSQCLKRPRIG